MEMGYFLTTVSSVIDDHPVAVSIESLSGCNLGDFYEQVPHEVPVNCLDVGQPGDFFPGYHQNVYRRLRVDIAESQATIVLKDDIGGNLSVDDFLEYRHLTNLIEV